jgi:hypothetical protein
VTSTLPSMSWTIGPDYLGISPFVIQPNEGLEIGFFLG